MSQASPTPSPAPAATPAEDPAVTAIAKREFAAWKAGAPDWSHYTRQIAPPMVAKIEAYLDALGDITATTLAQRSTAANGEPLYIYKFTGTNASTYMLLEFDSKGLIDDIYFKLVNGP